METILDFFRNVSPAFVLTLVGTALVLWAIHKAPIVPDDYEGGDGEIETPDQLYRKVIYKNNSPYFLNINNSSKEKKRVVLYGHNMNVMSPNFGSENGISVKSYEYVPYMFLLTNSVSKEFSIRKFRIQATKEYLENLVILITEIDPNGQMMQIPLIVKPYIKEDQLSKDIVDIEYSVRINGNTQLEFSVEPESSVSISLFYNTERFIKAEQEEKEYVFISDPDPAHA